MNADTIIAITELLTRLAAEQFTGEVTLHLHEGSVSKKVSLMKSVTMK